MLYTCHLFYAYFPFFTCAVGSLAFHRTDIVFAFFVKRRIKFNSCIPPANRHGVLVLAFAFGASPVLSLNPMGNFLPPKKCLFSILLAARATNAWKRDGIVGHNLKACSRCCCCCRTAAVSMRPPADACHGQQRGGLPPEYAQGETNGSMTSNFSRCHTYRSMVCCVWHAGISYAIVLLCRYVPAFVALSSEVHACSQ